MIESLVCLCLDKFVDDNLEFPQDLHYHYLFSEYEDRKTNYGSSSIVHLLTRLKVPLKSYSYKEYKKLNKYCVTWMKGTNNVDKIYTNINIKDTKDISISINVITTLDKKLIVQLWDGKDIKYMLKFDNTMNVSFNKSFISVMNIKSIYPISLPKHISFLVPFEQKKNHSIENIPSEI